MAPHTRTPLESALLFATRRGRTSGAPAPRVFVAEDQPATRACVARTLRAAGYEVVECNDGAELLALIHEGASRAEGCVPADVVVSDLRMPGPSGLEVLARIRLEDWATPFILMSGALDAEVVSEAQRMGAAAILEKPFLPEELVAAVAAVAPVELRRAA